MKFKLSALAVFSALMLGGCSTVNHVSTNTSPIQSFVAADVVADIEVGEKIFAVSSNDKTDSSYIDGIAYQVGYVGEIDEEATLISEMPLVLKIMAWPVYLAGRAASNDSSLFAIETVKAQAAYKAISTSEADIIIMPRYEVTVKKRALKKPLITVKVEGYKGNYKKFSNAQ